MTKNNLPGSRLYLEALGYKKTTAKNRPAATKTARTGAPAKAVTSQPPKAAANKKPKISAAEKNKRKNTIMACCAFLEGIGALEQSCNVGAGQCTLLVICAPRA